MNKDMDTLKNASPIAKIHNDGFQAIINGDNQKIVGKCFPNEVQSKINELLGKYEDVSQDADGDIIYYEKL